MYHVESRDKIDLYEVVADLDKAIEKAKQMKAVVRAANYQYTDTFEHVIVDYEED